MVLTCASSSDCSALLSRSRSGSRASVRATSSASRSRSLSSPAAFSVKVTATMPCTSARPLARIRTIRFTSSVVLPVPAAASTTSVSSSAVAMVCRACWSANGFMLLRTFAQGLEVAQLLRRLVGDAPRLMGAADRKEVAPRARALAGRGGQEAELDGAIDDLERLEADPAVALVDRDLVIDEAAGGRAIEQPARLHRRLQRLLDRQAVEHRLKNAAAPNHGLPRCPVPVSYTHLTLP